MNATMQTKNGTKTDLECQLICEEKRQTKGKRKQILRKNYSKIFGGVGSVGGTCEINGFTCMYDRS